MPETDGPNKVIQSSRQVLERKLLTALEDEGTVAVLWTKADLDLLIPLLRTSANRRADEMAAGLEQLRREAFGK